MVAKCCMVDKEQECEAQERESEIVRPDQNGESINRDEEQPRKKITKSDKDSLSQLS